MEAFTFGAVLSQTKEAEEFETFPARSDTENGTVLLPSEQSAERFQIAVQSNEFVATDAPPHTEDKFARMPVAKRVFGRLSVAVAEMRSESPFRT